jgi:V8-like Glu-specific endopeptidase
MKNFSSVALALFAFVPAAEVSAQQLGTAANGRVVTLTLPGQATQAVDYANALPMPVPMANVGFSQKDISPTTFSDPPTATIGSVGSGQQSPVVLFEPKAPQESVTPQNVTPYDFGTSNQVYTTAQVNATGDSTSSHYPYSAAGKLFFNIGRNTYVCSASLIKRGVIVTAAHCVANYGQNQFYSAWQFVPAYNNGTAPYNKWTGKTVYVLNAYYNGTDLCYQFGIICPDDVAVITLNTISKKYPGTQTGWFGYGTGGYGYNNFQQVLISQLGYPQNLDSGSLMERNDSQGTVNGTLSNNTLIGSGMAGGASGGPWLVNLGNAPSGITNGSAPARNVVVGVTGWGATSTTVQQAGASPFTSNNITVLVNQACGATPAACQ